MYELDNDFNVVVTKDDYIMAEDEDAMNEWIIDGLIPGEKYFIIL